MGRTELLLVLALVSCTKDREVIETPINFVLDDDDLEAKSRLAKIELEVWPATSNACPTMSSWRTEMCGQSDCSAPPSPRDRQELPEATAELVRDGLGAWSPLKLSAPTQGPWELVVRGLDANGAVFLYGCKAVSAADAWDVYLWRPWCDVEGLCRGLFHPACLIEIDCVSTAPRSDDPDEVAASPVVCRALRTFEESWEENGVSCPPRLSYWGPCYPARIACEPGRLEPERDGVCPRESELPCGADRALDLDCDNEAPPTNCDECTPGTQDRCTREDGICHGIMTCGEDGMWGGCILSPGEFEDCDGVDTDCDNLASQGDDVDLDAIDACNRGQADRNLPIADGCVDGQCRCGVNPPCRTTAVCRSGRCEPLPDTQPKPGDASVIMPMPIDGGLDAGAGFLDAEFFPDASELPDAEFFPDADLADADAGGRRDSGQVRDSGT